MFSILVSGYEALKEFGISQPKLSPSKDAELKKIRPISFYILSGCAVVGAIIAIAGYIFSQIPIILLGVGLAVVSGLGAYEINRLSLLKEFDAQIIDFKTLIDLFKTQIKRLSDEKKLMDTSISKLQTQIKEISDKNKKIDDLAKELKKTDGLTADEINKLDDQAKELKALKEGLEKQVEILVKTHADLQSNFDSQTLLVDNFAAENKLLSENVEELKKNQEALKNNLKTFTDENEKLKVLKNESKATISTIKQETARIQKQSEELKKALESLHKTHENLQGDIKKKEEVSSKLEKTVEALVEKVNKKLEKIVLLKADHEKKLTEQEEKFNILKLENELLKSENNKLKVKANKISLIPISSHAGHLNSAGSVNELNEQEDKREVLQPEDKALKKNPNTTTLKHISHQMSHSPSILPIAIQHHIHESKEQLNGTG